MDSVEDREAGQKLHERLIAGDETAPSAIAEAYFPAVVRGLARRFRRTPLDELVVSAASDAFMGYFQTPTRFNPSKGPLLQFLRIAAERDLLNALKSEARRQHRESGQIVELSAPRAEGYIGGPESLTPENQMLIQESPLVATALRMLREPTDQAILRLMMDGVRETSEYARVLRVHNLPASEQREIVKRNKDRIKRTLQRHLRSNGV